MKITINDKNILKQLSIDDECIESIVVDELRRIVGERVTESTRTLIKSEMQKYKPLIKDRIEQQTKKTLENYLRSKRFGDDVERLLINEMSDAIRHFRRKSTS